MKSSEKIKTNSVDIVIYLFILVSALANYNLDEWRNVSSMTRLTKNPFQPTTKILNK